MPETTPSPIEVGTNVFLSYSRDDDSTAAEIRSALQAADHQVWIDTAEIRGGERWRSAVVDGIHGSDVVVALVSRTSVESPHFLSEVGIASEIGKRIVPTMLEDVQLTGDLQYILSGVQRVDLSGDHTEGIPDLLSTLASGNERAESGTAAPVATTGTPADSSRFTPKVLAGLGALALAAIIGTALLVSTRSDDDLSDAASDEAAESAGTANSTDSATSATSPIGPNAQDEPSTGTGADCARALEGDAALRQANLQNCSLDGADLSELDLTQSDLRGASLQNVDLSRAVLARTRFDGADLSGATVTGAHLYRAELSGASGLDGIDWADTLVERSICDDGDPCDFVGAVTINSNAATCSADAFARGAPIASLALQQPLVWQDEDEDCLHDEFEREFGSLLGNPDTDDDGIVDGIDGHGGDETPLSLFEQFRLMG